jgi:triosephosphate isomerase
VHTPLIVGNWKMNTTIAEGIRLAKEMLDGGVCKITGVEKLICPPFLSIVPIFDLVKSCDIKLGAQNVFWEEKGAFTGEISPLMLAGICEYVIIGHSERRQYFNETDETINKKVIAAQKAGITPIICVGENLRQNEAGMAEQIIVGQLKSALFGVCEYANLVIAYEPIWAIGTGKAASGPVVNETISVIRRGLVDFCGGEAADATRILYGGSVTADNIAEYIRQPEIDGALVGGASLKAASFLSIINQTSDLKKKVRQIVNLD